MSAAASPGSPVPVPEQLGSVPPGAVLAGLLEDIDVEQVSGYDTIEVLCAQYRQLCRQAALFYRAVLETGMRKPFSIDTVERVTTLGEFAAEEARTALVWSRSRAEAALGFAFEVFQRLPLLGEAMLTGQLDEPRARALITWTDGLDTEHALAVCEHLLPTAGTLTVGELIDRIKRACLAIDPSWAEKKYRAAVQTRRVRGYLGPDGTGTLTGQSQPAERIIAACERIDTLARACKRAGDTRPIDHIRSDLFLGMTDGTLEGLTEPEIITHILTHPYTLPGDNPADPNTDNGGDGDGGGGGGDDDNAGDSRPGPGGDVGNRGGDGPGESGGGDPDDDRGRPDSGGGDGGRDGDGGGDPHGDPGGSTATGGRRGSGLGGGSASMPNRPDKPVRSEACEPDAAPMTNEPDKPARPEAREPARSGVREPARSSPHEPARAWAVPELSVQLGTLLGRDGEPGEVPGWGYVPAWLARHLVARMHSAQWRYALCDADGHLIDGGLITTRPATADGTPVRRDARRGGIIEIALRPGEPDRLLGTATTIAATSGSAGPGPVAGVVASWAPVLAELAEAVADPASTRRPDMTDPERRTPGAPLRRRIQQRDRRCIHPCCRVPAAKADQDHRIGYADGGPTTETNLSTACRHDHRLKDEAGWAVDQPQPGLTIWTSPLGHRYQSRPPPAIPKPVTPRTYQPRDDVWHPGQFTSRPDACGCMITPCRHDKDDPANTTEPHDTPAGGTARADQTTAGPDILDDGKPPF